MPGIAIRITCYPTDHPSTCFQCNCCKLDSSFRHLDAAIGYGSRLSRVIRPAPPRGHREADSVQGNNENPCCTLEPEYCRICTKLTFARCPTIPVCSKALKEKTLIGRCGKKFREECSVCDRCCVLQKRSFVRRLFRLPSRTHTSFFLPRISNCQRAVSVVYWTVSVALSCTKSESGIVRCLSKNLLLDNRSAVCFHVQSILRQCKIGSVYSFPSYTLNDRRYIRKLLYCII